MAYLAAKKMDLAGKGGVVIEWNDGHRSVYPYRFLRAQCTCAFCKHEWTGKRLVFEDQVDPGVFPVSVSPVGRYGVSFTWHDGHSAGIYTFDNLRAICQCFDCTGKELQDQVILTADDLAAFAGRGSSKGGCGSGSCGCGS